MKVNSPSQVFMEIGKNTMEGYRIGVQRNAHQAWSAWAGLTAPTAAPRGSFNAGHGVSSAMGVRPAMGGGGGTQMMQPVILQLDGRTIATALIPHVQRTKVRTGTTGLS
jgi:hypothetical protein